MSSFWRIVFIFLVHSLGCGALAKVKGDKSLLYKPVDHGVNIVGPVIRYDFRKKNQIRLNQNIINMHSLQARVVPVVVSKTKNEFIYKAVLAINWPESLFKNGPITLDVYGRYGKILLSRNLTSKQKKLWRKKILLELDSADGTVEPFSKLPFLSENKFISNSKVGIAIPFGGEWYKQLKKPFSFCLKQDYYDGKLELCSSFFSATEKEQRYPYKHFWVKYNNESKQGDFKGEIQLKEGAKYSIAFMYNDLSSIKISGKTQKIEFYDIVDAGDKYELSARCLCPVKDGVIKKKENLKDKFGFNSIIKPEYEYKTFRLDKKSRFLITYTNDVYRSFLYDVKLNGDVPLKSSRIHLVRAKTSTYNSSVDLKFLSENDSLAGIQGFTEVNGKNAQLSDLKKGYINELKFNLENTNPIFEIYRGYSTEASGRFSSVISADGSSLVMQEFFASHWFESLLGWDQYYLGRQRWGLTYRQFSSLVSLGGDSEFSFSSKQLDLKYRLTPGVWGYDESWGLILSGQQFKFSSDSATFLGGGVFWARSLPNFLESLFNKIFFMKYPKWVDVEFLYYPMVQESNVTPGMNYNLNFHGKVMWRPDFFGEAGFGLKKYQYEDEDFKNSLTFFYVTFGVGYQF